MVEEWHLNPLVPDYIKPITYDLLINPDLQKGTFGGTVNITIKLNEVGSYIPIHIKNLEVLKTTLSRENGDFIPTENSFCEKNQFWVLNVSNSKTLQPGIYRVTLEYKGSLIGKIVGFYKSSYSDSRTKEER